MSGTAEARSFSSGEACWLEKLEAAEIVSGPINEIFDVSPILMRAI